MIFDSKYRFLFIFFLTVYSHLNIIFTGGDRLFSFQIPGAYLFLILFVIITLLWKLNRILNDKIISLQLYPNIHPLLLVFGGSVVGLTLFIAFPSTLILYFLDFENSQILSSFKLTAGFSFRVNLFLNCINAIYYFVKESQKAQLKAERLQKDNAEAQFIALRNQVNPHFLFNNLNVLSSLVYKDPEISVKFINQLSKVYRYLLNYQNEKAVTLEEELKFIDSYLFLLKIRFQENLDVNKDISEDDKKKLIVPVSLQLLIENAIKHNVVSNKKPLAVDLSTSLQGDYLIVKNKIQPKPVIEPSNYFGIESLKTRYALLNGRQVHAGEENGEFVVRIPLIKVEEI